MHKMEDDYGISANRNAGDHHNDVS
jgi:hypothetical protein